MSLFWTDVQAIARELVDTYPEVDPQYLRFTELHRMICTLPDFSDDPKRSNEKILEAIQMIWLDERD